MAFSADDIASLEAAIATGALKVRYADGREVTYRSLGEIERVLSRMQASVGAASGRKHSVAGF